jgi:TIR domain
MKSISSVFISYSNEDQNFVFRLKNDLNQKGINTWVDVEQINPGALWIDEMKIGIEKSGLIILVLGDGYRYSRLAIHEAKTKGKKIIPIKINVKTNQRILHFIDDKKAIDFSNNYENALRLLLEEIPDVFKYSEPVKANKILTKGYVFISFCDEDAKFVIELREFLKSQKFAYWDYEEGERNYHTQFFLELESVIEESAAVLSIISPSWKSSRWSTREYFYSEEIGKPVFLLRAKETTPILAISGQPYIDFVSNSDLGFKKLEKELSKRLK